MWISSCQWYRFPTAALSASGIRVEGESFLSACQNKLPCIFCCQNKTGATFCGRSCKKSLHDDFLRRHYPHQVKGRSWMTSSQPAHTSSPVFISSLLYMFSFKIASGIYAVGFFPQNRIKVPDARERSAPEGDTPVIMSFVRLSRNNRHIKTELDTDEIRGPTTYVNSKSPW